MNEKDIKKGSGCWDCKFAQRVGLSDTEMECRKNPPVPAISMDDEGYPSKHFGVFPIIHADAGEWCGAWEQGPDHYAPLRK